MRRFVHVWRCGTPGLRWRLLALTALRFLGFSLLAGLWLSVDILVVLGVFLPLMIPGDAGPSILLHLAFPLIVFGVMIHVECALWPFTSRRR